jgi:glutathione peroxidase
MTSLSLAVIALLGSNSNSARAADAGTSGQQLHTQSSSESKKQNKGKEGQKMSIYDFQAQTLDGKEVSLGQYKGDVVLIVNTASKCGFTPQYQGLEELHQKFSSRGLKVLGFPCNQFGEQEPGGSHEIANFCQKNYGVDFQMFDKIDVNGPKAHPLYKYLTSSAPGIMGSEAIKWNFTKFLIDRQGNVLKRYAPNVEPKDIEGDIEKQL